MPVSLRVRLDQITVPFGTFNAANNVRGSMAFLVVMG